MARLLIILIALSAILLFGTKFYFEQQIRKSLDQSAQLVSMAGEFRYEDVRVTHEGEIRIEGLAFRPYDATESATVDLIAVRPGNILKLIQLEKDFRNNTMPESLGFSIHGVEVPVGGEYEKSHADSSRMLNLGMAGCAYPAQPEFPGLDKLGYSKIDMNMDLDYEIIGNGEHIRVSLTSSAEELSNMIFDLDMRLGAPNRQLAVLGMAMNNAQLNSLTFKTEDKGFEKRLMEHCAKSAELALNEYYDHHLQAWQNMWKNMDLQAGKNFSQVYRSYIEKPQSFELNLYPTETFKLNEFAVTPPNILIYHLKGNVKYNNNEALPLDLTAFTGQRQDESDLDKDSEKNAPIETPAPLSTAIEIDDLPTYLQKPIVVSLKNGKTYKGQAQSISDGTVQFLRNLGGGQFMMPIRISDIDEIEIDRK